MTPSKRWLAAAAFSLTVLLLVLLVAQRSGSRTIGAPTRSSAGGKAIDSSVIATEPARDTDVGAFCNITGDCGRWREAPKTGAFSTCRFLAWLFQ